MSTVDASVPERDRRAVPAHTPPTVRRSAQGCTKLRDSCQSCAASKIKCPKEKPSCSKCEARGIECQYFFARRPGRRREDGSGHQASCTSTDSSSNSTSSNDTSSKSSTSSSSSSSSPSNPKSIPDKDPHSALSLTGDKIEVAGLSPQHGYAANGAAPPTNLPAITGFFDTPQSLTIEAALTADNDLGKYSSDFSSVLADTNMFYSLSDFDPDPNDIEFNMTDYFEHPSIDGDGVSRSSNDIGSLLIPETINFGLGALESNDHLGASFAVSSEASVPTLLATTGPNMTMMRTLTTDISCGCVTQSLDLLKTLSSTPSSPTSSMSAAGPALSSGRTAMGAAQAVLIENKQHIETVNSLLSCSLCTEDSFRLVIVSMIVLKILERYASTARAQVFGSRVGSVENDTGQRSTNSIISSSKDHMRALSHTYTMPRDDIASGHAPARLVLSELHRVQTLVNLLSPKLRGSKEGDARGMEHTIWGLQVANENDKPQSTPFSSNTLAQMESDMRNSLSSLAADIIKRLRQN
ncbi:uncharacterized protein N7484_008870 [Penicillium longicatenatum]|uniref:uncharacterized protein n=1 Tax=Penicillium longicatenatum TaxID=1561947 RepID=UPI0025489042|nr:uncharacterized protein N7484_008870 [Penicillium longicatenatum]KAJ5635557.1 hypothetical protein N7484_008870 [Penicillium longicatenatum]